MLMATIGFTLHLAWLDLLMLIYNCSRIWLKVHFAILLLDPIFFVSSEEEEKQSLSTVIKTYCPSNLSTMESFKMQKKLFVEKLYPMHLYPMKTIVFWVWRTTRWTWTYLLRINWMGIWDRRLFQSRIGFLKRASLSSSQKLEHRFRVFLLSLF